MERPQSDLILHGALGGIVAGAVVVVWFLVVDLVAGEPFHTPARLASIVLGEDFYSPWPRLVSVYTILHFGIFISLGLITAGLLKLFDIEPGLLLGAVFGVGVFNAVHYGGLLVTGTNFLTVISVVHVVAANLLGGMLMMAYLHRALRAESPLGWNVLRRHPLVFHGVITGLVGAAAVALWFFLLDLGAGSPFHTPAALGSAVLLGVKDPADVQLNLGVIVAYSFLHIAAFILAGVTFAWLASRAERGLEFWLRAALVLVLLEGLFLGTLSIVARWVADALGGAAILVANLLAVVTMGVWSWRRQPRLREELLRQTAGASP